jgi:hypothetical protein
MSLAVGSQDSGKTGVSRLVEPNFFNQIQRQRLGTTGAFPSGGLFNSRTLEGEEYGLHDFAR